MAKYFYITIIALFMGVGMVQAQEGIVTGPKAKNRKPWKNPKPQSTIVVKLHDHDPMTGPVAKNRKPYEDICETVPMVSRERRKLTGPWAKNARPERGNYWEPESK
ncbi:hypothetical protein [Flagellimonas beolgyonensis]|uniref:hypothetical protein n=1 Tax=Flagellimonas beolgyonensis TaxID=864064 RepID=UPI000F8C4BEF|nr:hypothetical protein [Allomuricauda beolgyonensis]